MVSRAWRLLCAACLTAAPVAARPGQADEPRRVALILFERGAPDPAVVERFREALAEIDRRAASVAIVGEREMDDRLGADHLTAAGACGANLRCIAAIGEKTGAAQVLLGRATSEGGGVEMQWLLVGVRTAGILGKLQARLTGTGSATATAERVARELLGVTATELGEPAAEAPLAGGPTSAAAGAARPRARWSTPGIAGVTAVACGVLSIGVGVHRYREGDDRADEAFLAGSLLVAGGAALWTYDRLSVTPVVAVGARSGYAGLMVAW